MNSPPSPIRHKINALPGFRPSQRQRRPPIAEMSIRELQDLHKFNTKVLASPGASTSTYVQRVLQEQQEIESRLLDVDGIEKLNTTLKRTRIKGEGDMEVDDAEPPTNRTIEAKRKALAQYGALRPSAAQGTGTIGSFTLQEAMELEKQAHLQEQERQQRILEKKKRQGVPIRGEVLTREEQEARLWAFLNHKPTDSDLEVDDDDEDESDDEDPAGWFEDDQDDGVKGQDIIEPDFDDELSHIIQVDESRIAYDGV